MEFRNKRVLVVGSGKSGIGAARLLGNTLARPVLFDSNDKTVVTYIHMKA